MLQNNSYETGVDEIDWQNFELIAHIGAMMQTEDNRTMLMQLFEGNNHQTDQQR